MDANTTTENNSIERTCADMLRDTVRNYGHDLAEYQANAVGDVVEEYLRETMPAVGKGGR